MSDAWADYDVGGHLDKIVHHKGEGLDLESLGAAMLYEICDRVHSSCTNECPVFEAFEDEFQTREDCPCFKNGRKMMAALRSDSLDG